MIWKKVLPARYFSWTWILVAIALIPIVVIGSIAYRTSSGIIASQTESYAYSILLQVMDNIDGVFRDVENIATLLYTHPDVQNLRILHAEASRLNSADEIRVRNLLENTIGYYSYIEDIILRDQWNNVYSRYPVQDLYLTDYYQGSLIFREFQQSKENTQWYGLHEKFAGMPQRDQQERYVFSYIRNISDLQSIRDSLATLHILISKSAIDEISEKVIWPDKGTMVILDAGGRIVYYSDRPELTNHMWNYPEMLNMKPGAGMMQMIDDREQTIHMVKSEATGWVALNMVPKQSILLYSRAIRDVLMMTSAVSIIIVIVSFHAVISRISLLLGELRKIAVKVSMEGASTKELVRNHIKSPAADRIGVKEIISVVKQLMMKLNTAEQQKKAAEFAALQANIHPHFLYNTLDTIRMMAVMNHDMPVASMTEKLANLFRYIVNSKDEFVALDEEIEHVKNYVNIQQARFGVQLAIYFDMSEKVGRARVLRLCLQPLIENAILHGLEHASGDKVIRIKAYTHADKLSLCVIDNGQGIGHERLKELRKILSIASAAGHHKHIGLNNIHQRFRLYFGVDAGLRIYSVVGMGTIVKLTFPYEDLQKTE